MVGGTTRQQKGGCDGKRGAEADGRGGAGRGGNGAHSPSGGALTQPWPGRGHRDTSPARRGPLAADRGPDAGLSELRTGAAGGPVWPIRLAAGRCGGGVHENGAWGRSGHPGPLSYARRMISRCAGQLSVNTFLKGRAPAKRRPSMHNGATLRGQLHRGEQLVSGVLPRSRGSLSYRVGKVEHGRRRADSASSTSAQTTTGERCRPAAPKARRRSR